MNCTNTRPSRNPVLRAAALRAADERRHRNDGRKIERGIEPGADADEQRKPTIQRSVSGCVKLSVTGLPSRSLIGVNATSDLYEQHAEATATTASSVDSARNCKISARRLEPRILRIPTSFARFAARAVARFM